MLCLFLTNLTRAPLGPVQVAFDGVPFLSLKFMGEPAVAALPSGVTIARVEPASSVRLVCTPVLCVENVSGILLVSYAPMFPISLH